MATRLLVMFSLIILELAIGIASILGVTSNYRRSVDEAGAAGIVMIVALMVIAWLVTIALSVRGLPRAKAQRIVADARIESARILADATEKALALCSLEGGRCPKCGNPRTGKFCPKCGSAGGVAANADYAQPPTTTSARVAVPSKC
ncbi:MAG: hypothetical protein JWN40_5942 [Phycisphaerales bacterium]|nr:hypothetical protein [Phycisphaerales bacterium]